MNAGHLLAILGRQYSSGLLLPQTAYHELSSQARYDFQIEEIRLHFEKNSRNARICEKRDEIAFAFARQVMDAGEADAIAQSLSAGISLFITDDVRCQEVIAAYWPHIRPHSLFFCLVFAHLREELPSPEPWIAAYLRAIDYHRMGRRAQQAHAKRLRQDAQAALEYINPGIKDRRLQMLTRFSAILKNYPLSP